MKGHPRRLWVSDSALRLFKSAAAKKGIPTWKLMEDLAKNIDVETQKEEKVIENFKFKF